MSNIGRNDPCPCGSGKKYKKCCLPRDQAAQPRRRAEDLEKHFIAEVRPDLDAAVDRVLERLELGAGRRVEPEIVALLKEHPHYHTTNFAMGVYLALVMQDPVGALPFFEKAVQIFPLFPEAQYNLGNAALKAGDITKAVMAYRAAVRYSQDDDGVAELANEELQVIEKVVVKASPFTNLDAYLANVRLFEDAFERLANGDFEEAIRLFNGVLSENPAHVQSYGNLALAHAGLGRRAVALECLERALALDPHYGPALSNQRVLVQMREGEPFVPDVVQETHYYAELLNRRR
jgi:tetratricopeptide (TPR) repeat protein